jgi:hypothetical protein
MIRLETLNLLTEYTNNSLNTNNSINIQRLDPFNLFTEKTNNCFNLEAVDTLNLIENTNNNFTMETVDTFNLLTENTKNSFISKTLGTFKLFTDYIMEILDTFRLFTYYIMERLDIVNLYPEYITNLEIYYHRYFHYFFFDDDPFDSWIMENDSDNEDSDPGENSPNPESPGPDPGPDGGDSNPVPTGGDSNPSPGGNDSDPDPDDSKTKIDKGKGKAKEITPELPAEDNSESDEQRYQDELAKAKARSMMEDKVGESSAQGAALNENDYLEKQWSVQQYNALFEQRINKVREYNDLNEMLQGDTSHLTAEEIEKALYQNIKNKKEIDTMDEVLNVLKTDANIPTPEASYSGGDSSEDYESEDSPDEERPSKRPRK